MEEDAGLDSVGAERRQRRRDALLEQQRTTMNGNTGFHLSPEAVRQQRKEAALREQEETTMDGEAGFYRSDKNYFTPFDTTTLVNHRSVWNNEKEDGGEPPKFSPEKALIGGVRKGINRAATAVGDTLAFAEDLALAPFDLFSGQKFGTASNYGLFNELANKLHEEGEAIDAAYADDVAAGGFWGKLLYEGTGIAVELIPQAVMAIMTAGGSTAAQTTAGLQRAAQAVHSPGVKTAAAAIITKASKDPQYWLDFCQTVGRNYEQAQRALEEQSLSDEISGRAPTPDPDGMQVQAAVYAISRSLIDAGINTSGGINTLPNELQSGKNVWRGIAKSSLREGAENTAGGIIDRGFDALLDDDPSLISLHDRDAVFSAPAIANDFAAGTIAGGALSGVEAAVHQGRTVLDRLAQEGEALLMAGKMPSWAQLQAMNLSESEALGRLAVMAMEDSDTTRFSDSSHITGRILGTAADSFDEEHLAKHVSELLPNYKSARVPEEKLTGYALNSSHPTGKHKAAAFEKALGYTADNKDLLLLQVYHGLEKYRAVERSSTAYGRPFEVSMMILGANGRYAKVKTAWIIDVDADEPRLVSIYVDE